MEINQDEGLDGYAKKSRTGEDGALACEFCKKTFERKDAFKDHIRSHTGEKPFTCGVCGKSFSRSFVMRKHEKIHLKSGIQKLKSRDFMVSETQPTSTSSIGEDTIGKAVDVKEEKYEEADSEDKEPDYEVDRVVGRRQVWS